MDNQSSLTPLNLRLIKSFSLLCCTLGLSLALLAGCQKIEHAHSDQTLQHATTMSKQVSIKIGESGESFAKQYEDLIKVNRQPAGIDFYQIDWKPNAKSTVTIEHGNYSLAIVNVLGVIGSVDHSIVSEGLSEFDVVAGLTESSNLKGLIFHDEARMKTYAILQEIIEAGWRPIMYEGAPRISGKDRFNYTLNGHFATGLDPSYAPTFAEWMQIEDGTPWYFYADHLFLEIDFSRDPSHIDPSKPSAYLLSYKLKSEAEHYRGYVDSLQRAEWKKLLPQSMVYAKDKRAKIESELRTQGVHIDETYLNPPLLDLK